MTTVSNIIQALDHLRHIGSLFTIKHTLYRIPTFIYYDRI